MTRQEFIENVTSWWDLIDFCRDEGSSICDSIYDEEGRDDFVNDRLSDWTREYSWQEVLGFLDQIPTGYDYYRYDDYYDEWEGLDNDDFYAYKDDVLEWADDHNIWDEEDEDEEGQFEYEEPLRQRNIAASVAEHDPEDDVPIEEEDFSIDVLFASSIVSLNNISAQQEQQEVAAAAEFAAFVKMG